MLPPLIVAHKERRSSLHRLSWRLIILQIDLLIFDRPPQPFHKDIVERPSPPVHTNENPCCCQPLREVVAGELCPLIGVENVRSCDLVWLKISAIPILLKVLRLGVYWIERSCHDLQT